jgi:Na+/melibiose symporter-like transporter
MPSLFNVGWASVQISNLAIVPLISYSQRRRDEMVNGRNIFTYLANIIMLTMSLILFAFITSAWSFRILAVVCTLMGGCTSIWYIIQIKEVPLSLKAKELDQAYKAKMRSGQMLNPTNIEKKEDKGGKGPCDWMKECQFYLFGLVYMFARIGLNVNATMMPFYLINVLGFNGGEATSVGIAAVPLVTYTSSMFFTLYFQKPITQKFANRLIPMLMALAFITVGATPLLFLEPSFSWAVYFCSALIGVGLALMLNTGTSLISDVLGGDVKSAAFVYGAYSLLDKFANGFLLFWLVA